MSNALHIIRPYRWNGPWVFTDKAKDLTREPFVAGADTVIDMATSHIPAAGRGFLLLFSAVQFPSAQICLRLTVPGTNKSGNTYHCDALDLDAWLCPALYEYFETAPTEIWAEFRAQERKNEGKIKAKNKDGTGTVQVEQRTTNSVRRDPWTGDGGWGDRTDWQGAGSVG